MFEDLIYQVETMIADADGDRDGLMKMRKLVDILNTLSKAAACEKIVQLRRKAGHSVNEWQEKRELAFEEARKDLLNLKLLLKRPVESKL